jgi:intergrase/recombinase
MKTVTLGGFRFRERNGKVYVYKVEGDKERYIGPLHEILSKVEILRGNNGENSALENAGESEFTRNNVESSSGISETELEKFYKYCLKNATETTCRKYVNYLKKPLSERFDSIKAYRLYYRWRGEEEKLKKLKIPRSGSDLKLVTEEEIKSALAKADDFSKYIIRILLESGARLSEITKVLNEYDPNRDVYNSYYYIYELNWARGRKKALYIFHITQFQKMNISYRALEKRIRRYINPKLIRKFTASKMYELGIPVETIDFIEGRAPETVSTKHYIYLLTSAKRYYQEKWIPYLQSLLS